MIPWGKLVNLVFTPQSPITMWGALVAGGLKPPPMPWRRQRESESERKPRTDTPTNNMLEGVRLERGVWGLPTPHPRSKAKQREPERSKLPGGLTRPACLREYQLDRDGFWAFLGELKCLTRYSAADPPDSRQIHSFPREVHIDAVMSVVVFFFRGRGK